jgi:hypothetical protein
MTLTYAPLIGLLIAIASQQSKTYTSPELGLSFTYPADWTVQENKRLGETRLTMGQAGSSLASYVLIYASATRDSIEQWQLIQETVAKQLRLTMEKQWQEELLGVPLLLSRTRMVQGAEPTTMLTGLLYTRTARKFHFRLVAPSQSFDEAERKWREVLLTLQTTSGELPKVEDPSVAKPEDPTKRPPVEKPKPITRLTPEKTVVKVRRAEKSLSVAAAGRPAVLYYPENWEISVSGNRLQATSGGLRGTLQVEVFSTLDSPQPEKALLRASGESLASFRSVTSRQDQALANHAGARCLYVLRTGVSQSGGKIVTLEATGASGDLYWLIRYRADPGEHFDSDRGRLMDLIARMSVEPGP